MRGTRRPPLGAWRKLRRRVWERDAGRCRHCEEPVQLNRAHIDHVVPLARGGSNDLANLRTLCKRCHVLRAGPEHVHMVGAALRQGIIGPDWREHVWSDEPEARPRGAPARARGGPGGATDANKLGKS